MEDGGWKGIGQRSSILDLPSSIFGGRLLNQERNEKLLNGGSGAARATPTIRSIAQRSGRLRSAALAKGACGPQPSRPSSSERPSSRLRNGSPLSATIL